MAFSQQGVKWGTGGNSIATGDFFGTTNNFSILFKVNNIQRMYLNTTGILQLNSLAGTGIGFTTLDANGNLMRTNFPNDPNKFLNGNGTFSSISTLGGWSYNGNNIFNPNSGFVGIGTSNPQFILDVNGDARVNGTLYAQGIVLATKMQADSMKSGSMVADTLTSASVVTATMTSTNVVAGTVKSSGMISINNNLNFTGGLQNEIYTYNGDVRMQSLPGYNGNTILNAGTNGNVGVGIYSPQYKFDVNGDARVSGKMHVYRLFGSNGDSIIRFGDSTMNFNYNLGQIYNTNTTGFKGIGIGNGALANALHSTAIGFRVWSGSLATDAVTIGCGVPNGPNFIYNKPSSLAVGFNSTIPTFFVGPANGVGTYGNVGIRTTTPLSDFQVGDAFQMVAIGGAPAVHNTFSTSYIGFNVARVGQDNWTTGTDGGSNGGTILLSTIGGGFRIIGISSSGVSRIPLTDQQIQENTKFYIRDDGRVIIGNPTPQGGPSTQVNGPHDNSSTKLSVDGTVLCRELFVTQNNWADSIFSSNYNLISLDSLQSYLDSMGHLPGVPSVTEVQKNGNNLGQTDVILLAKMEELTLYVLQLQKQNAEMKKEIDEFKKK